MTWIWFMLIMIPILALLTWWGLGMGSSRSAPTESLVDGSAANNDHEIGGYILLNVLAKGGMATIYEAVERAQPDGQHFAIKLLSAQTGANRKRLQREAQMCLDLQHPSIVKVYGWGIERDLIYIAMEKVEGVTLTTQLGKPWAIRDAILVITAIMEGVAHAHEMGIVHRDLKPDNIMMVPDGTLRILDFGIARGSMYTGGGPATGAVVFGTPHYMAPEQLTSGAIMSAGIDQYAMGLILFEMLTGRKPFEGEPSEVLVQRMLSVPRVADRRPEVPAALDEVVARMMAIKPQDRFESVEAARAALLEAMRG